MTIALQGKATIEMIIDGESVIIEVDGDNAPITAGNFVDLVDRGVYDNTRFHRVIKEPSPFVAQGGDPQSKDPEFPFNLLGTGGFIDPVTNEERTIPLEITPEGADEPVYSQTLAEGVEPELKHDRGVIAMARAEDVDSASSQFYITLAEQDFLNGDYAVFGKVVEGMEIIDQIPAITPQDQIEQSDFLANSVEISDVGVIDIESMLITGTEEDDSLTGTSFNDQILGLEGDDVLTGREGNDIIDGNAGNDQLTGDQGRDLLLGKEGDDSLVGSSGGDQLRGGNDDDQLFGEEDDDTLLGASGNDQLLGGNNDDRLFGGNDQDTLLGDSGADEIRGGSGDDQLSGDNEEDTLVGVSGNDQLSGGDGDDRLFGGDGDDTLIGGLKNDQLFGGEGSDRFVFDQDFAIIDSNQPNSDTIDDFNPEVDLIAVSAEGFGGGLTPGELSEDQFQLGSEASTPDHRFIYDTNLGILAYDIDGNGEILPAQIAFFEGIPELSAANILII